MVLVVGKVGERGTGALVRKSNLTWGIETLSGSKQLGQNRRCAQEWEGAWLCNWGKDNRSMGQHSIIPGNLLKTRLGRYKAMRPHPLILSGKELDKKYLSWWVRAALQWNHRSAWYSGPDDS